MISTAHVFRSIVYICMLFYVSAAFARDVPKLVTDRPDQTESSVVVPAGYVQIESGVTLTSADDFDLVQVPGTLARIGILDNLELRVGIDGWLIDDATDTRDFGDSVIGIKYYLWGESGWIPESAVLAGVSIPTSKTSEKAGYSIRWAGAYTLSDRYALGFNLAASWDEGIAADGGETMDMIMPYSAVLGIGMSDELGAFIEFFGESPVDAGGKPSNLIDGGFTYLLTGSLQLDFAGGVGVSDAADDWFAGAGVSYRFER